jgi:hypothetical protein
VLEGGEANSALLDALVKIALEEINQATSADGSPRTWNTGSSAR